MSAILYATLALAAGAIPISVLGFQASRITPNDEAPPTLWERIVNNPVKTLLLVLLIGFFLWDIDVTSITLGEIAILLAAISVPVSLLVVATQIRDVRWGYLVQAVVVMTLPALVILTVHDVIPDVAGALFGGVLFSHITTYLDTD